jgi:cobalt-zinc-cadmium efflux system membrane fusion protein
VVAGLESKLRRFGVTDPAAPAAPETTIRSSFAGVVVRVQAAPGDVVDSGVELFEVTDLSEVWVQAEVYEKDLGRVQTGQPARISVDTYPGETFSGTVAHVSDRLDPKTRTAQVRCVVSNRDRRLKLDMFATVDVPTSSSRRALAVPSAAIQEVDGKPVVFVRQSDRAFLVRGVTVGRSAGGQTEILEGLAEREPVVVQGAHHLKSIRLSQELGEG